MKTISTALKEHMAQDVTTLATCWKVTRRDGTVLGFTDHDQDISYSGVDYIAASGFNPTSVQTTSALNVDNLDVEGLLDNSAITEEDIMAGIYDFAEVSVFIVNYEDLSQNELQLRTGWMGEVMLKNGQFVAEVRGLTQHLNQTIGELYSPACRAKLGDVRCGVDVTPMTVSSIVSSVESQTVFADTTRVEGNGYFANGKLTFTSGVNAGLSMEVKEYADGTFTLVLPMPYAIAPGDAYSAEPGCDKTFSTCVLRYDNAVNFRGEPHVPGTDRMLETSSTRSEW